ncbi:MAG: hypothetical protein Kow0010_03390 [Dehalococcoidia bacterium]
MKTYAIRRRNGWKNASELAQASSVSARVGTQEMPDRVKWIRSYVVNEDNGDLGTLCIYQGVDAEAVREHARRAGMPADEVTEITDTVIVNDDPISV